MNGRFFLRFFASLILLAVLVGVGVMVYQFGVTQGLAASGKLALPAAGAAGAQGAVPYPYYTPFWHPWGFWFFPFGLIFPLLGFFLIFGLIRALIFGGWHGRRYYRGGPGGFNPDDVPPYVAEWHRKMHESGGVNPNPQEQK